ncbi:hypothetical protein FA95DRAFT_1606277 [Auriscalpium vulgare]|uniref:Uncharacterized protein n=1 Tax=Auriscalpium vulgare TaxID=40419 RepID=A0ACB8RTT9_9AGAM|nr:hypothetical protein FA95DRAFT_1606277 [Auriscalpium vulgare]
MAYPQNSTFTLMSPIPPKPAMLPSMDESLTTGYLAAALGPAGTSDHLSLLVGPRTRVQLWQCHSLRGAVYVREASPAPYMYRVDHVAAPTRGRVVPIVWSGARMRPEWPVWFDSMNGGLGVGVVEAMRRGPLSRHGERLVRMFADTSRVCISWPGCQEYSKSFPADRLHQTATADELLYNLAWAVHAVLSGNVVYDHARVDVPRGLEVGVVRPEDVTIVGALNLAQGKWYPILRVAHR